MHCLKPLVCLTLQSRGEDRTSPLGVIQSSTTPFKLLVSSDLAPEEPFCIYTTVFEPHKWVNLVIVCTRSAICHTSLSSPLRIQSSRFREPAQRVVKTQYSCLSLWDANIIFLWKWAQNDFEDLLAIECLIGTKFQFCYLSCMEKTWDYDSMDGAHGVNSASKMLTIVNKWICSRAAYHPWGI